MHPRRIPAAVLATTLLLVAALVPLGGAGAQDADDTVFIEKDDEALSNADVAVRLSETTPFQDVERVVVARDDDFADALASGVMQAAAPLLLVARDEERRAELDQEFPALWERVSRKQLRRWLR